MTRRHAVCHGSWMDTATAPMTRTSHPWLTYAQVALTLLATTMLGLRTLRTANGQTLAEPNASVQAWGAVAAGTATAATAVASVLLLAQRRRPAAAALVAALGLELIVLERVAAPPRLVTALPLVFSLALFALVGRRPAGGAAPRGEAAPSWRTAAGVVALVLMVPVGLLYLMSGLVVPAPALYAVYLMYGLLLAAAALLARRRSTWALAVPPAALGLWFLVVTLGGEYLGWQA